MGMPFTVAAPLLIDFVSRFFEILNRVNSGEISKKPYTGVERPGNNTRIQDKMNDGII